MKKVRGVYEKVPGSGDWWIRFTDAKGKLRREKAGSLATAKQLVQARRTDALRGKKLPESLRAKSIAFAAIAKDALEHSRSHKRSFEDDEERMAVLLELFGSSAVAEITPQLIERGLEMMRAKRRWAPATVNRYKALLSMTFQLALHNGKAESNPARLVRRYKESNGVIRYLSREEEARLRNYLESDGHFERWAAVLFAMNTGLRAGEQAKLRWSDVDHMPVTPQIQIRETKNGHVRYIPLNASALSALETAKAHSVDATIFSGMRWRKWFEYAAKKADVKGFRWHDLRHTFASRMVMAGCDIRTLADLLGHSTIQMTMRYAHLAPEHKARSVSRLDAFYDTTTDTSQSAAKTGEIIVLPKVSGND